MIKKVDLSPLRSQLQAFLEYEQYKADLAKMCKHMTKMHKVMKKWREKWGLEEK